MAVMVSQTPCLVAVFPDKSLRWRGWDSLLLPAKGMLGPGEAVDCCAGGQGAVLRGCAELCWAHQAFPAPWPHVAAGPPNPKTPQPHSLVHAGFTGEPGFESNPGSKLGD